MIHLVNNYLLSLNLHVLTMNQYRTLMHMVMSTVDDAEEEAINYLQTYTNKDHKRYYKNNNAGDNCLYFFLQMENKHFVRTPCTLSYIQAHDICEFLLLNHEEANKP